MASADHEHAPDVAPAGAAGAPRRQPEPSSRRQRPSAPSAEPALRGRRGGAPTAAEAGPEPTTSASSSTTSSELTAKAEKADEYLELAQRTQADFENYRKRATREAAAAQERGIAKLAKELLPAVDNLDRALDRADPTHGTTENGTSDARVRHQARPRRRDRRRCARAGIERFSPEGERFDPQRHEAIAQQPVEGAEPGTVVEVYQRGYRLGDVVIRPARVVVAA